ncbi:MAG: hypothetical protein MJ189_04425 [Coriobacteriales bacterium]|nr:hypothetical protein [Coriobacteriales bacterium]
MAFGSKKSKNKVVDTREQMSDEEYEQLRKKQLLDEDGNPIYPAGLEPDLLEGPELEKARRKEKRYTWLLRAEIIGFIIFICLVLFFIFTK